LYKYKELEMLFKEDLKKPGAKAGLIVALLGILAPVIVIAIAFLCLLF
jgi:hypothetical protein